MEKGLERACRTGDDARLRLHACAQIEEDEFLRVFQSYINRYRSPYEQSYSQDPLYYSVNIGRERYQP